LKVYGDYTQEELNRQYNQAALVPDFSDYIEQNRERSKSVRKDIPCKLDIPYGPSLDERLDIFPTKAHEAPILIYHHGGAWCRGNNKGSSYIAESCVSKGVNLVIPGFSLAPKVTLDEIVRQNHAAIVWSYHHAKDFGGNSNRIYVGGHSSGGHLAAMMLVTDWSGEYGLPENLIKGAVCLSGMYDLEPVRLSHRNEYLFLDERSANRNSPILYIPEYKLPIVIGYGDGEHDEFKRQSDSFAAAWEAAGHPMTKIIMKNQNHFEVEREWAKKDSPIMKRLWAMLGLDE